MNNIGKNLALWVIIGLLVIAVFNLFQGPSSRGPVSSLAFSDFLAEIDSRQISDVTIKGPVIDRLYAHRAALSTY